MLRAGGAVSVTDALFASAFGVVVRGVTVTRVWQGVASVLLGKAAFEGGRQAVGIGLAMHVAVAFTWSALFLVAVRRSHRLRAVLDSAYGALKVASVLGPGIWLVMSLAVIPALVHRLPAFNGAYLGMLVGHIFFVGWPMAVGIGSGSR